MKKLCCILSLIIAVAALLAPASALAYEPEGVEIKSKAVLLYSIDTGDVMYEKNVDQKMYPASLTKLMTALVTVENCKDLDAMITCDSDVYEELLGSGLTVANLKDGEKISVRNLLHLLLICSSADAGDVLANYIGGSVDKFIDMMNQRAKSLGMNNSHFKNVHGMHSEDHYTTASDMLKLSKAILEQHVITDICEKSAYTVPATNKSDERMIVTTNMMQYASSGYYYKYTKGLKTGFTTPAGRCLISTASYKGYNYLCIVLGGDDDIRSEFSDSKALYRWAFLNFEYRKIYDTVDVLDEIDVKMSSDTDHVQLFPEKPVAAIIPEGIENDSIICDTVLTSDSVNAPIKKGQVLGYARVMCAGQEVARVNLVAGENVERSYLMLIKETAVSIFSSNIFRLLLCLLGVMLILAVIVNIIHNKRKRRRYKRVNRIRKY